MSRYVYLVFTQPTPGQDDEYNRWYGDVHLGDLLRVPGVVSAKRFKLNQADSPAPAPYLAVYEFDCDDVAQVLKEIEARAGTDAMPLSPALDIATVRTVVYEAI